MSLNREEKGELKFRISRADVLAALENLYPLKSLGIENVDDVRVALNRLNDISDLKLNHIYKVTNVRSDGDSFIVHLAEGDASTCYYDFSQVAAKLQLLLFRKPRK